MANTGRKNSAAKGGSAAKKGPRSAGGLRGLDLVPPTPPSNSSAPDTETEEEQQASLPASNGDNQQAGKPAPQTEPEPGDTDGDASDGTPPENSDTSHDQHPPEPPGQNTQPESGEQGTGQGMQWGVDELVGGIDPEEDRHQTGIRLPKYVFEALRLKSTLTRRQQQRIVADAVKAALPSEMLDETYRRLYGRQRPHL